MTEKSKFVLGTAENIVGKVENIVGKGENAGYSKPFYCRQVKTRACLGKG